MLVCSPRFIIIVMFVCLLLGTLTLAGEDTVQFQIDRQYREFAYEGKLSLDFTPFEAALTAFPAERIAQIDDLLNGATIPTIQAAFADGRLTSRELTLYYLHRIRQIDVDGYNTILRLNPDALIIAEQMDAERAAGDVRGMLHGIVVTLKDNIGTGDRMPTAAGSAALADSYADRDAFIVTRLRDAGAIILGKNNLSEWANFMTFDSANGFSVLGGQTRNAYGRFDVGGSSSGGGASVALNLTTVSVGSETSGSLVYPASQNSVATFKPSLGLISRDRIIPITDAQDTAGPMARNMTDLVHLLDALSAYDANDPLADGVRDLFNQTFADLLNADALRGVRVGVVNRESEFREGDNLIRQAIVDGLRRAGAEVVDVRPLPYDVDMFPVLFYGFHVGVNEYLRTVNAPLQTLTDIMNFNAEDLANRAPYGQTIIEAAVQFEINPTMQALYDQLVESNRATTRAAIRASLQDNNVRLLVDLSNYATAVYASAGTPALNIPAGYRASGEPNGATLVGDWLDDAFIISAGYALEQALDARREPSLD